MLTDILEKAARPISEEELRRVGGFSNTGERAIENVIVVDDRARESRLLSKLQNLYDPEIMDRIHKAFSERHIDWTAFSGAGHIARRLVRAMIVISRKTSQVP
jgi:hypothetical protein